MQNREFGTRRCIICGSTIIFSSSVFCKKCREEKKEKLDNKKRKNN